MKEKEWLKALTDQNRLLCDRALQRNDMLHTEKKRWITKLTNIAKVNKNRKPSEHRSDKEKTGFTWDEKLQLMCRGPNSQTERSQWAAKLNTMAKNQSQRLKIKTK